MKILHTARLLVAAYLGLSLLSVIVVAITGGNTETWVHTIIITIMAILLFVVAHNMTKGKDKALLRVRIVVAILIPALLITLIVLAIPLWLRIEHALAIVVLVPVALIVFHKRDLP